MSVSRANKISIIIPTLNEKNELLETLSNIEKTIGFDGYEVIVINSGGTNLPFAKTNQLKIVNSKIRLGVAQAKNLGANISTGRHLVFLDAHVRLSDNWGKIIVEDFKDFNGIIHSCIKSIDNENLLGYGFRWGDLSMKWEWIPSSNSIIEDIPFAAGAFIAIDFDTFSNIGGFDSGLIYWGGEDAEISLRSWLFGYKVKCHSSIEVAHKFRDIFPYTINWKTIYHNQARIAFCHFGKDRFNEFIRYNSNNLIMNNILYLVITSRTISRRQWLFTNRVYSDDWFFTKFPMCNW